MADELPDRSPLLTGQPSAPQDPEPWSPPYVDASEHGRACKLQNAREVAAFVLGWRSRHLRQLIEDGTPADWPDDVEPGLFHLRIDEEQAAAVSAALVQVGASVSLYSTTWDQGQRPGMTLRVW